jgi:predicted HAD superfamily Cof-like phosphohydrolase
MTMIRDIADFHTKFGLAYNDRPRDLPEDLQNFRVKFMQEELNEYAESATNGNLEGQLDALVDLVYVALGTAYMQGFNFKEAWRRVHEANMRKVRATSSDQSKRGSVSDVVKPVGWTAPDLSDLVK